MNELTKEKTMTTKEVARALGLKDVSSVTRLAKKCLPDKKIENGKPTFWTESDVSEIIEYLKTAGKNQFIERKATAMGGVKITSAALPSSIKTNNNSLQVLAEIASDIESQSYEEQLALANLGMLALQSAMKKLQSENDQLQKTCDEQAHALEYSKAIGKRRWRDVKKEFHFKFTADYIKQHFEKDVEWFLAIMGNDKYPTLWVSDTVIDALIESEV